MLPTTTVVPANSVPVEGLHYASTTRTAGSGSFHTYTPSGDKVVPIAAADTRVVEGLTFDDANDRFVVTQDGRYSVQASLTVGSTSGQFVNFGISIDGAAPDRQTAGIETGTTDGLSVEGLFDLTAGQTIDFRTESANAHDVRSMSTVIKQVPSSTVISPTDTVVNDQAASGFIDIGTTRIQWGTGPNGDGPETITFPQPFANNTYSFTGTFTDDGTGNRTGPAASVGLNWWTDNKTTTSITWDRDDDIDGLDLDWIAIGVKP